MFLLLLFFLSFVSILFLISLILLILILFQLILCCCYSYFSTFYFTYFFLLAVIVYHYLFDHDYAHITHLSFHLIHVQLSYDLLVLYECAYWSFRCFLFCSYLIVNIYIDHNCQSFLSVVSVIVLFWFYLSSLFARSGFSFPSYISLNYYLSCLLY